MNNPLYQAMQNGNGNIMQMLSKIKSDPMSFIMQRRFNVPQNMAQDPNAILQHLLSTGQISQQQVNAAYQQMSRFK